MEIQRALIFAEGGLSNTLGKTAHGLLRGPSRYKIVGVIDSTASLAAASAALAPDVLRVPLFDSLTEALRKTQPKPDVLVIGIAPSGYDSGDQVIHASAEALDQGLDVHSGLHTFLSEEPRLQAKAIRSRANIIDVRRPPKRQLQRYRDRVRTLPCRRVVIVGHDAAVGKRTTAIKLAAAMKDAGKNVALIGTGQTAWLQGLEYGIRLDALPMDFAAGELESEILRAYKERSPDVILIEGQASLLNPGYSAETAVIVTASAPTELIYVVAPLRSHHDSVPTHPLPSYRREVGLLETLSGAPVVGFVINTHNRKMFPFSGELLGRPAAVGPGADIKALVEAVFKRPNRHDFTRPEAEH